VALRGERFDAHDFLQQARASGAAALMCERRVPALEGPVLLVPDCRRALGELARGWRSKFRLPLIAVTGSNGKTTVKEMLAAILAQAVGEAGRLATRGNLNNEIGLPLTLFRLRAEHRMAVVELGMNRPGEIAWLASIAAPHIALVNNAQREHQEFMHSVAATAYENGAVISALASDGVAVFPGDDAEHTPIWRALAGARRRVEFGLARGPGSLAVWADPDSRPADFSLHVAGTEVGIRLAIAGAHNVRNALAAAACAHALGLSASLIVQGLESFRPAAGRLVRLPLPGGAVLFDDTYNANPDSVRAAIDLLADCAMPRVLVLGDMGEVGAQGPAFHAEVGRYARERSVQHLLLFGQGSREALPAAGDIAEHFDELSSLVDRVRELAGPGASVLVKGSRFMRMERVVAALTASQFEQVH
jgi:UDP-N-acetylmuramoyl-tripeptide--D-alanyl-D-alanine ligase